MVVSLDFGGKCHVSNGCKMYLLRIPAQSRAYDGVRRNDRKPVFGGSATGHRSEMSVVHCEKKHLFSDVVYC